MSGTEQMELRLLIPKSQKLHGEAARNLVAKSLDGMPSMNILFNRSSSEGNNKGKLTHAVSSFRFGGGEGLIRIFAIGKLASEWLEDNASTIRRAVSGFFEIPIAEQRYFTTIAIQHSQTPIKYRAFNLVTAQKVRQFQDHDKLSDTEIANMCGNIIAKGIERQIDFLDLPTRGIEIPISITNIGDFVVAGNASKGYQTQARKIVEFSLNAEMMGSWAAGNLMSTGRGIILPLRTWNQSQSASNKVKGVAYVNI